MQLGHIKRAKEIIGLFKTLRCLTPTSHPYVNTDKGIGHNRLDTLYLICKQLTVVMAMHGFTKNYIRVELSPADSRVEYDNQLMQVRLADFNHDQTALRIEELK